MVMTLDTLRSVTLGALAIDEQGDGFHFHRFTEKQRAAWNAFGWRYGARAEATCGVRLDFITDARALSFYALAGNYELHIDGLLREHRLDGIVQLGWGSLPPASGYPAICVPIGVGAQTNHPIGITFMGTAFSEPQLIAMAYAFEQKFGGRIPPKIQ